MTPSQEWTLEAFFEEVDAFIHTAEGERVTPGLLHHLRTGITRIGMKWVQAGALKEPIPAYVFPDRRDQSLLHRRIGEMNAEFYELATGKTPDQEDLDRVNCPDAGKVGHLQCGWCHSHHLPRFFCMCDVHLDNRDGEVSEHAVPRPKWMRPIG